VSATGCGFVLIVSRTQDMYIFFGGAAFTLFMFWVIWHYLG